MRKLCCFVLTMAVLMGCMSVAMAAAYTAGSYTASAQGNNGDVAVTVVFDENAMTAIELGAHAETAGIADAAIQGIPAAILAQQSLAVDVISGATNTSNAILNAVADCVKQAGGDPDALRVAAATPVERVARETETTDVVIVGAGLSGLTAAYELKDSYPEVNFVLLEKLDVITGSLPTTGGYMVATDSKQHERDGVVCTTQDIGDLLSYTSDATVRRDFIDKVFAESGTLFDTMVARGVPLNKLVQSSKYNDKVYGYIADNAGAGYAQALTDFVKSHPIDLRTGAKVVDLVVEDGAVKGVLVQSATEEYQINAKAVLLATGGFGSNPEMVAQLSPEFVDALATTNAGATGDGFALTARFGTKTVGYGMMGSPRNADGKNPLSSMMIVNTEGNRFIGESEPGYVQIRAMSQEKAPYAYKLTDANYADPEALKARVDEGAVKAYDTLEALAADLGIDAKNLQKTVETYNADVDAGRDPGLGLKASEATKVETAPFYAEKIILRFFGTIPGIEINDDCAVLTGDGQPVAGLYASGELTAGNAFTRQYPGGGIGIAYAANSGRYAATRMAESLK
ncbi:MAG: FAD-dependent oxidoreductase [Clostridia bacterium]